MEAVVKQQQSPENYGRGKMCLARQLQEFQQSPVQLLLSRKGQCIAASCIICTRAPWDRAFTLSSDSACRSLSCARSRRSTITAQSVLRPQDHQFGVAPDAPLHHDRGVQGRRRFLWDFENTARKCFIHGKGPGDAIWGLKFCPTDLSKVYAASGEGTLTLHSLDRCHSSLLHQVHDCGHDNHHVCNWYCCLDVSLSRQMLATGDNLGTLLLLSMDGQKIFSEKLHKAKVTHAEFNPRCDWLMATSSVDHSVKLWDLRNIKNKNSFLYDLPHVKAVNSAYFSPVDCTKLLTTDQYDQIRIYSSSDWSKPQHIIQQPHRQFQHLTPIKATWHPTYDLVIAGRYPDGRICPGTQRTVDIYDANTEEMVYQLYDAAAPGIKSINKFSPMGDVLASAMSATVLVWDRDESLLNDRHKRVDSAAPVDVPRGQRQAQPRSRNRAPPGDKTLLSLEEETQTKTKNKRKKSE
ncbi:hypothetical protein WMY93_032753 [Mugilogobius chulae]|uniref:DNA damage-binding protein 2 n=1 Tax=Mugilogobius chulae TaxID=88201 RepID=A0AAW0MIR8_9GOBI